MFLVCHFDEFVFFPGDLYLRVDGWVESFVFAVGAVLLLRGRVVEDWEREREREERGVRSVGNMGMGVQRRGYTCRVRERGEEVLAWEPDGGLECDGEGKEQTMTDTRRRQAVQAIGHLWPRSALLAFPDLLACLIRLAPTSLPPYFYFDYHCCYYYLLRFPSVVRISEFILTPFLSFSSLSLRFPLYLPPSRSVYSDPSASLHRAEWGK